MIVAVRLLFLWGCADSSADSSSGQDSSTTGGTEAGQIAESVAAYTAKKNIDANQVDKAETVYVKSSADDFT